MKVLNYTYEGLYQIQAQTQDIQKSWDKFKVRVTCPEQYCNYSANTIGKLSIYDYSEKRLEEVTNDNWAHTRPVFFETCEYSFAITFFDIKEGTVPSIVHENSAVESLFSGIEGKDEYILTGNINFLNQPGRFALNFTFTSKDGVKHNESLKFDVVSPKLDTKGDLNTIIKELKIEYDDLVFRYLTLTHHLFSTGKEANNDLIWLSIFKEVIDSYLISVRHILNAPHNKHYTRIEHLRADRIKKWTNPLAEEFSEDRCQNVDKALRKYYRNEIIDSTVNTLENRFVKYTIERISERLGKVFKQIKHKEGTSQSEIERLIDITKNLDSLRHNSFFRGIGRFEGFKQESMVLQQRSGYAQVYRHWILLQRGLDLIDGDTSVGVQPIWKLYELWCFLKVKKMVAGILGIDLRNPEDLQFVHETTKNSANPFFGGDLTGTVKYDNPKNGDVIEIGYQYSFNYRGDKDGFKSMTVEQKPDIVMHIHKKDNITLTYLFDAKYRVHGEDDPRITKVEDFPVEDTLNQMHRYRDAIYYGEATSTNFSKEVVGGYILFPGRLEEEECQKLLDSGDFNSKLLPYYIRSIEFNNIGAFPLLPNEDSGILLKRFLEKVILQEDMRSQVEDAIPQRGLYYSVENEGTSILIACYKNEEHRNWIIRNGKYNLRLDKNRRGAVNLKNDYTTSDYLLLYEFSNKNNQELFRVTGESEVMTAEDLTATGYPAPGGKLYLVLDIDNNVDSRLKERTFSLPDDFVNTKEGVPQVIKYVNLFPPEDPYESIE